MSSTQNDLNTFPLNLEQLKKYAKRWVEKFPHVPIENITLYGYSSHYSEVMSKKRPGKYCIVFDITGEVLPDPKNPETADSHIDKIESFNRSIYDIIEYYHTIRDQDSYLFLMDAAFPSSVYHDKPDANFTDEWMFLTRRLAEGNRDIMIKEPYWVIFDVKDRTEIHEQMQEVPVDQSAIPNSSTPDRAASTEHADPEAFIRSLKISYIDNTEVKIQYKGRGRNYTGDSMGFRDSITKEWKTFIEILEAKDHFFRLGPAHYFNKETKQKERIDEYGRRRKLLEAINKKLISFFTQHYNIKFPHKFEFYELLPAEGKGVYSFKFQIPSDKPSYKTKEQALECLTILKQNSASEDEIHQAAKDAMDAGATKDEINEIVQDILPSHPEYNGILYEQEKEDEDKED